MDIEMVFNELSAESTASRDIFTIKGWMSNFIETTRQAIELKKIDDIELKVKEILHIDEDFFHRQLASDYSLAQWLNDRCVNRRLQQQLLSLTRKGKNFNEIEEQQNNKKNFSYSGKPARGLGIACMLDTLALSFHSDPQWDVNNISLQSSGKNVPVYHASHPGHLKDSVKGICQLRKKNDPWLENGLPKNGQYPYIPPKRFYSHKLSDFKEYSKRGGFLDNKKQIWVWDEKEKHWDVQFPPYGRGKYLKVTRDGQRLD